MTRPRSAEPFKPLPGDHPDWIQVACFPRGEALYDSIKSLEPACSFETVTFRARQRMWRHPTTKTLVRWVDWELEVF